MWFHVGIMLKQKSIVCFYFILSRNTRKFLVYLCFFNLHSYFLAHRNQFKAVISLYKWPLIHCSIPQPVVTPSMWIHKAPPQPHNLELWDGGGMPTRWATSSCLSVHPVSFVSLFFVFLLQVWRIKRWLCGCDVLQVRSKSWHFIPQPLHTKYSSTNK